MQKNIIGFKKIKVKIITMRKDKKKVEKKTLQNCKIPMYMQRFITTIKSVTEYKHTHTHIYIHIYP